MPTEGSAPFSGLELDTSLGSITDTDILSYFMNDDTDLLNTYLSTNSSTSTSTSTSASTATSGCSYDASSSSSSPSHTDSSPGSSPLHATPQSPLSADGGSTDLEASLESIVKQEPTENPLNLLPHSLLPSFPTIKSEAYSQKSVRNFKQEDQKCSNKKRSHSSSDSEDDDSCLSLSRDELLKLTSKGLEAFTQNLSTARGGLTQDEERQLKRQRRLIKNRESAQLSRMRKKIYIEDLERKVTGLTSVNEKLTQQVSALALQNKALRDEVAYLHSVIKQSNPQLPSAAATTAVGVVPPTLPLLAGRSLRQEQVHSALGASRGLKTAGVCLLIVLFSFGLFFNSISRGKGPTSAGMHRYTGRVLQSLPDEVDTPRLPAAAQSEQVRDAIEVFDDEPPKPSTSELMQPAQPAAAQPKLIGEKRALRDTSTPSRNVKKVKIQDDTNLLPATDDKDKEKEAHSLVSLSQRQQLENPEEDFLRGMNRTDVRGIHWRPNTRYLFCSDPQHVRSPEPISVEHEGSYPAVSFLLPSTAFNGSVSLNGYGENALVEINCQILGINVYPMYSISN